MTTRASQPEAWFEKAEHDLVSLLRDCRRYDDTLEALREGCEDLTRLGWASRYPDVPEEIDESTARQAVELAQRVRSAIRQRVPAGEATE